MRILLIAILLLTACSSSNVGVIPRQVPDLNFYSLNGEPFSINDFKGRKTILIFWATWCPYCRDLLDDISSYLDGREVQDPAVLFVSLDPDDRFKSLVSFLEERKLDKFYHSYSGNRTLDEAYVLIEGEVIPSIYIVDPDGTIVDGGNDLSAFKRHVKLN